MISSGSKGLGLGFGGRKMEEAELEEGEAYSYNNNNDDYDASTDPEADLSSLSYIDEKIQHVLGHLQKDFEGGVSAENLGAKFGGYGSFLPTYTCSPSLPHPNNPPSQSCNASRSPKNGAMESWKAEPPPPINFGTLPALKASSANDLIEQEVSIPAGDADELASRCESANKKAANMPYQKILKVRIKVGSDNLSTQKNAAIYSGLGLDVSPSSSLDGSPSGSERVYRMTQEPLFESPTSILRFMTSPPLAGETLVSPLPDHLLNWIAKGKVPKEKRSDSGKGDGILLGDKKARSVEKKDFPAERKSSNNWEMRIVNGAVSKTEVDIDILACEELVSKTLKLPLLSDSCSAVSKVKNKGIARNKCVHDEAEDSVELRFAQEIGLESSRIGSSRKILEEQKTSPLGDISGCVKKSGYNIADKTCGSVKADTNTLKSSKALESEVVDPPNLKIIPRVTSHEQDNMKLHSAKENVLSDGKRKSKGSHSNDSVDAKGAKESMRVGSSLMPNNKQTAPTNSYTNKRETGGKKIKSSFQRGEEMNRDVSEDIGESEQEENQTSSLEILSEDRPKIADKIEKSTSAIHDGHSDKLSSKKTEGVLATELFPRATMGAHSNSANVNVAGTDDYLSQDAQFSTKSVTINEHRGDENQYENHGNGNASHSRKSGKGSSWSKDKSHNFKSGFVDVHQDHASSYDMKSRDGRNQFPERPGVKSDEIENRFVENKESLGKLSGEIGKRENQSNGRSDAKPVATGGQDVMSTVKQNLVQGRDGAEYTKRFHSENHAEIASEREKSLSLSPFGESPKEMLTRHPNAPSGSQKGNGADGSQAHDALKVQKQIRKADRQSWSQQNNSRHSTAGGRIRDVGAPSPMRKDSSSQAANNALKEAKDLKHMADRVQNSGSNGESTSLYFQAALKFLHSASLLESCNNESTKHGEMSQSVKIYSSTAKL